jgi:hypothetical protein
VALRRALLDLGQAGAAADIHFVALKGAAWLLEDEAGCAGWRQMLDLDVLVHPERYDAAPPLLERLGYRQASQSKRYVVNFHHAPYRHPSIDVTLEVHRHVGWRHELMPTSAIIASARSSAPGLALPAPWIRAFHAIIHWQVLDHGGSRGTLPLKEIVEVARFLARPDVDWPVLADHAAAVGARAACECAVASAAQLLGAPVPPRLAPSAAARGWVETSMARRNSALRTWVATQMWRAGTLWWCEKVAYRCALRGLDPVVIAIVVWAARIARLPLLAVRAIGIAARALAWATRLRIESLLSHRGVRRA